MFTLDRMTLFFFSLSASYRNEDPDEDQSALINSWSSKIPTYKRGGNGRTASDASTPTLVSASRSSRASQAASTSLTAVGNKVKIKYGNDEIVDDSEEGIVSERDERNGGERALAAASPPKGKGNRVTSSVSDYDYLNTLKLIKH